MVIGIDVSRANTLQRTGVERYTWQFIQALKTVASSASVVLYSPNSAIPEWGAFPTTWRWKILKIPGDRFWTQLRLSAELFVNPPDVFFAPSSGLPLWTPAHVIATVHDVAFLTSPELYSRRECILQQWYLERIIGRANTIIVPTLATKQSLLQFYPQCARNVVMVPHGASPAPHTVVSAKIPNTILFVGRVEKKKNIPALVDAVESLAHHQHHSSVVLHIVGAPGYGFSEIEPFLKKCAEHIHWHGWLPEHELHTLRQTSAITAIPSLEEGFGFPILDAWQTGSIAVITPCPALIEVGGEAVVKSTAWDSQSLANALTTALDSTGTHSQWQQRGKEALKRFNWNNCAQTTFKILSGTYVYNQ